MLRFFMVSFLSQILMTMNAFAGSQVDTAFDRLKSLAGEWTVEGEEHGSNSDVIKYEVVSDGSAVIEHMFGMITVYHKDGDSILVTHYCSAHNQPRFRATEQDVTPNTIKFSLLEIPNLESPDSGYMAGLELTFADGDTVNARWKWVQGTEQPSYVDIHATRRNHSYTIHKASLPIRPVLIIKNSSPTENIGANIAASLAKIQTYMEQLGVMPADAPFARYTSFSPQFSDYEVGFVTNEAAAGSGDIIASTIGGDNLLMVEYFGAYEEIGPVYETLHAYMTANGLVPDGAPWESYVSDPTTTPTELVKTLVYYPVKAAK